MRRIYSLFALCALFLFIITPHAYAADYTIETLPAPAIPTLAVGIPLTVNTSSASSITQQVFLASELSALGATAGNITGIKFYYGGKSNNTAVPSVTRSLKIYLTEIAKDSLELFEISGYVTSYRFKFQSAGTYVYNGSITTEALEAGEIKTLSIPFNQSTYPWDGTKNILLTVFDETNTAYSSTEANLRFVYMATEHPRFVHQYWTSSGSGKASDYLPPATLAGLEGYSVTSGSTGTAQQKQIRGHLLVPKTTFTIVTPIPVPTSPSAGSISASSAVLSWTAAAGADSYEVRYGKTSGSLGAAVNVGNVTSYSLSELEDETIYYYQVRTKKGSEYSAWTDEASFTTSALAAHIHDGITFSKWSSTISMPTSGNYYLNDDVAFDIESSDVTLTGNLNLCLNGHTADLYGSKIIVPYGKTLAIYDNVGDGKITGHVASQVGAVDIYAKALIVVYAGGELELHQGTIENAYIPDEDGSSYAIYSNGTLHLSGDVLINSNNTDIYLYSSNVIILDGAISNAEKHTVYKMGGDITYGWSTYMSGEDPRDYFESSNSARAVFLDDDEAALRILLRLSENSNNSSIADNRDIVVDVALTRSLTSSQYNTFCLPFNLSNAQLVEHFGAGYDLEEFDHSNFDGETLELTFVRRYELTEGAPYLIKPAVDVVNPYFEGITIYDGTPGSYESDDNINVHSTFGPTSLEGGNKNLLFLGEDNTLFWPESTGNIKGFRAYFEVKGAAQKAVRARIVKGEEADQALEMTNDQSPMTNKILRDGHLLIIRDNKIYDVLGRQVTK